MTDVQTAGIMQMFGVRNTSTRQEILDLFIEEGKPLSYSYIENHIDPQHDRVTVYRTLKTFLEKGLIATRLTSEDLTEYELSQSFHDAVDKGVKPINLEGYSIYAYNQKRLLIRTPEDVIEEFTPVRSDNHKIKSYAEEYERNGYDLTIFKSDAKELVAAIREHRIIEDIDIAERIHNEKFRFLSVNDVEATYNLTEAFADALTRSKSLLAKKASLEGVKKRNLIADEYAINMHAVVNELQKESGISTQRGTVEILNQKGIETPSGNTKWHKNTFQQLQSRWKELGLIPTKPDPK